MPDQDFRLGDEQHARLMRYAEARGLTLDEAVNELASDELRARTNPKPCKGVVQPFRRR